MNVATTANFPTQLSVCLFLQKLRRPEPEGFTLSCKVRTKACGQLANTRVTVNSATTDPNRGEEPRG